MARELSEKQPVASIRTVLDKEGKSVSQPIPEYRTITAAAGESIVVSVKVGGVEVATLGPVVMPVVKTGKLGAVQVRMLFTDSAASLQAVTPEVIDATARVGL